MKHSKTFFQHNHIAMAMALAAGLVACGGGGSGGTEEQPLKSELVTVSAANQDTVAHAAAAAFGSLGVTDAIPLSTTPGLKHALAAGSPFTGVIPWATRLAEPVVGTLARALGPHAAGTTGDARPLAVEGPFVDPCTLGGSWTMTLNDVNGNAQPDIGDIVTIEFNGCVFVDTGTVNGRVDATVTALSGSTSMSLRMVMTGLTMATANHTMGLAGTMVADATTDAGGITTAMRMTADGPLTVTAHTHVFDDTVTIQSGFVQSVVFDANGTGRVTTSGRIQSTAMGGAADFATLDALVSAAMDPYPTAGAIRLTGKVGKLTLTAAGASVRMDLDDNDDNVTESTKTPTWDWLL